MRRRRCCSGCCAGTGAQCSLSAESQRRARTALVCYATRYEDGKLPAFFLLLNVPSRSRFSASYPLDRCFDLLLGT